MKLIYYISFFFIGLHLQAQEYAITSWNLKDFGKTRDSIEIKLIANIVKNTDLIAIQEVVAKDPGGAKAVARLVDELNRMGSNWDYRISDPTQSSSSHVSERYAFVWNTSKFSLTKGGPKLIKDLASLVEREPYLIQLLPKQSEIPITIINYHACTHKPHFPEREEIRNISYWLASQSFDNCIIAGDMNLVIDDIGFRTLFEKGYTSALNGEKTSLKKSCIDGVYKSSAEDNVLYKLEDYVTTRSRILDFIKTGDCSDVTWKRTSYSDHLPIEIILN